MFSYVFPPRLPKSSLHDNLSTSSQITKYLTPQLPKSFLSDYKNPHSTTTQLLPPKIINVLLPNNTNVLTLIFPTSLLQDEQPNIFQRRQSSQSMLPILTRALLGNLRPWPGRARSLCTYPVRL